MANDFRAWKRLFVLQWHNAASLRASFLAQVVGMIINNGGVTLMWILFISVFGTVNGWGAVDVLGSQGIVALSFGFAYGFCEGAITFGQEIRRGTFDSYLLRPLRVLPLVWRSHFSEATFGDMVFGLLLIVIACVLSGAPFTTFFIAILLVIPAAMIMVALSTITSCYAFWRPDDRMVSDMAMRVFLHPAMYPGGAFPPVMRIIFSVFVPALLVGAVPWETARAHALPMIVVVWLAGFAWLGLAALVFRAGLKRYESGGGVG